MPPLIPIQLVSQDLEILAGQGKGVRMPRKRYSSEQVIVNLREAKVELAKSQSTEEVCRKLGITELMYYR